MKLFLVGYRATGKTTQARLLAEALEMDWVDLDQLIEKEAGLTIKEIVSRKGWPVFRALERQALEMVVSLSQELVVACGGGAVVHEDLWPEIRAQALVIWLKATPETIYQRLLSDGKTESQRPYLTKAKDLMTEIRTTLEERLPLYEKVAHLAIETEGRSPFEVRDLILKDLQKQPFCSSSSSS
ncbi:shikimate kinase [Thermosulfuriphilus sp.]